MNRNVVVIVGLVVILIGVTFYYLSSSSENVDGLCIDNPECSDNVGIEDIQEVLSNDGFAELIIPKTSLPDNIDIRDISVTRVLDNQFENSTTIRYSLEPDGLVFKDEVLFQVSFDSVNDVIPLIFTSNSSGEVELVNNTRIEVGLDNKKTVDIPLTHFSEYFWYGDDSAFGIKASAQDTDVNKKMHTDASFTLYKDSILTFSGPFVYEWKFLSPSVKISGFWTNTYNPGLEPSGKFGGNPSLSDVFVGETRAVSEDRFLCVEASSPHLHYEVEITMNMKNIMYGSEADYLAGKVLRENTKRHYVITSINEVDAKCLAVEEKDDEPLFDPGALETPPEIEISYVHQYSQQIYTSTKIFVKITGIPDTKGLVTLFIPNVGQNEQSFLLNNQGVSQDIYFIVKEMGNYTIMVSTGKNLISKDIVVTGAG